MGAKKKNKMKITRLQDSKDGGKNFVESGVVKKGHHIMNFDNLDVVGDSSHMPVPKEINTTSRHTTDYVPRTSMPKDTPVKKLKIKKKGK